jgi:putative transposase
VKTFNAQLEGDLLKGESFYMLREAQIMIEIWRRHCGGVRLHGALGYRPPASEVFVQDLPAWPAALARPAPPAKLPAEQPPTLH